MRPSRKFAWTMSRYMLAYAALASPIDALGFKIATAAIAHPNAQFHDFNVTVPFQISYKDTEQELIRGVEVIESMKLASSCKTKTTRQLLSSCSNLDDVQMRKGTTVEDLEKVKSQYAAKLAVCELQEAASPPKLQQCSTLGPSRHHGAIDHGHLASCLRELQSNVVFWGSYTNNLQNVGYICHVARAEIEKDELVEQRQASLETTLLVTKVLSEFQQSVTTQNAELYSYAQKVRDLHRQNVEELVASREDGSEMLQELRREFAAQLQDVAEKAQSVVEAVTIRAAGSNEEVLRYVHNVQHSLAGIWQSIAEGSAELAARQLEDAAIGHDLALTTRSKLEDIIVDEIGRLLDGLSGVSDNLLSATGQVTSLRDGHNSLAESLDHSIARSSHIAQMLDELNVPVLEMFAKAAKFATFFFSDECLKLMGFFSPVVVLLLFVAAFQIRLVFWLSRLGLLLTSSYVVSRLYNALDSSPTLQSIFQSASQAITTSIALVSACGVVWVCNQAARNINYRVRSRPSLAQYIDEVEEDSRYKQVREKSLQNAMKSRLDRASTSPPC